jgi:hypothetical protein
MKCTVREVIATAVFALAVTTGCGGSSAVDAASQQAGPAAPAGAGSAAQGALNVAPASAEVAPGATMSFSSSSKAAWSVVEPGGGTIDSTGNYTAPQSEGTYHVVATGLDGAAATTAPVTVKRDALPPTTPPADGTTQWAPSPSDTDWVNVKSFGAVGDSVADDTAAFRNAAATGKKLFIPGPAVAYKLTAYVPIQNSVYGDGSMPLIRMYGADGDPDQGPTHSIFYVNGYQGPGLVINGVHLDGQWNGGTNGEYSMGVNIVYSSNVTVQNSNIEGAYGDDVFVGAFAQPMSSNIVIQNNTLGSPRRCNIAVNGATNVVIRGNQVNKTGGYVSAIDLEPDQLGVQYVRGVVIDGNVFNVAAQDNYAGAVNLNNPAVNPASGDVSVTNNHGTWTPATYMDTVPNGNGLISVVPSGGIARQPWYNVTASNNTH